MLDLASLPLLTLVVFLAVMAVEFENLMYAVLCFCGMTVAMGFLYWLLNAPYVALFQILVYTGAVGVLFIITIMLTERR
jgi:NADH:ubiquinone oxidoreductase subunit 6 (subunit J)